MEAWTFEPGHTAGTFRARHMMVTWVRGKFKDIHGRMTFGLEDPLATSFEGEIDARKLWTGEPVRDEHLRSADFFDVANHPRMPFSGRFTEQTGSTHFKAAAELTIRGNTRTVPLDVVYLGEWAAPFWVGDENKGQMRRIGFEALGRLDRREFEVSWNDALPGGGVVASTEIEIVVDVEAIADADLERTGAIAYYRGEDD
jgi:polyisoprenoid-binding protein YceI